MHNFNTKHFILIACFVGFTFLATAQTTSPIKTSNFRKFSVGVNAGILHPALIIGGSNDFTKPQITFGYGANLKYQLTHYFAIQADLVRGNLKGDNSRSLWSGGPAPTGRPVYSFTTDLHYAASINGVFTFGWLAGNKLAPYISAGGGLAEYSVKRVLQGSATVVDYGGPNKKIKEFFVPVGLGLKINISRMANLDLGYRMNFVDGDNLDGTRLVTSHKDKFQYAFLGVEFSLGDKSKQQLMFFSPVAQLTSQVNNMQNRLDAMEQRISAMDTDIDGDGVVDRFDKEPNTEAGCAVDTHGVSLDTDGDGVPDCKDQEKITPTACQPVDANGVGVCPIPACCSDTNRVFKETGCNIGSLSGITFKGNTAILSADAKAALATVASKLRSSASCTITITGNHSTSKYSQTICNRRVEAVKNYLSEKEGISAERITINCEEGSNTGTVEIRTN